MKKVIWILVAAIALAAGGVVVWAKQKVEIRETQIEENDNQQEIELVEMGGVIVEIGEDFLVLEAANYPQVQVNLSDDTMMDGEAPAVGQYVKVLYTGAMTRSVPPQIYALRIGCYPITGNIVELREGEMTIMRTDVEGGEEIIVHLPEGMEAPAVGASVTVYTSGMMTMSLPAQVNAEYIVMNL